VGRAHGARQERPGVHAAAQHPAQRRPAGRDDVRRTQAVTLREHDEESRRGTADTPRRAQRRPGRFPSIA